MATDVPLPLPTPTPEVRVYHYQMPTMTCLDDLTGTIVCYPIEIGKPKGQSDGE